MSTYDLPRLETFSAVASHYSNVKPMKSKNHPESQDLRPLGDRSRKWERVKKFSDTCYAYYDGDIGDNISYWGYNSGRAEQIPNDIHFALAPIVWTLEEDGTETLRVRNGSGQGAHNGRYSFLERALPRAFTFAIYNGKQFLTLGGTRYFLPKSDFFTWRNQKEAHIDQDDKKYLEFVKRPGQDHGWTIKADTFVYEPPRMLVDKERKKQFKPAMDSYYDWLCIMAPMFRDSLIVDEYDYRDEVARELAQSKRGLASTKREELLLHAQEQGWSDEQDSLWNYEPKPQHALIIMEDEEHPMRMHMAWQFLMASNLFKAHESDRKLFRSQFNRWINKVCGFNIKIEAQVITKGGK